MGLIVFLRLVDLTRTLPFWCAPATMVDEKKSKERLKKFQSQKNPAKKWKCMRKILGSCWPGPAIQKIGLFAP